MGDRQFGEEEDAEKTREEVLGIGSSKSVHGSPLQIPPEMVAGVAGDVGLATSREDIITNRDSDEEGQSQEDDEEGDSLATIQQRLEDLDASRTGDGWAQRDELAGMVSSLSVVTKPHPGGVIRLASNHEASLLTPRSENSCVSRWPKYRFSSNKSRRREKRSGRYNKQPRSLGH